MLPIHYKRPNGKPPPAGNHFIVAQNGLFLHKETSWIKATIPVENMPTLEVQDEEVELLLPPLPADILAQSLRLAKAVFDISKSEVCLLLHHGKDGYQLTVPEQVVSPGGIDYNPRQRIPDAVCVGTIHSHGIFEAGHSRTDIDDEADVDGVHITVGDIQLFPAFSISAHAAVNGSRFGLKGKWFKGLRPAGNYFRLTHPMMKNWEVPAEWLKAVRHQPILDL